MDSHRGRWGTGSRPTIATDSVWPAPSQLMLLRAGLCPRSEAIGAWNDWRSDFDTTSADPSSVQLFPLVYRNLAGAALSDPELGKLRVHYLATWASNQRLFRKLEETLRRFQGAGIPTLLLKGAALVPLYYKDEGIRGMGDFDILVPEDRFHEATGILQRESWRPLYYDPNYFDPRFEHAIAFVDERGNSVDLHCHALIHSCEPGADEMFWEASRDLRILGVSTRTLSPTDHVIQLCAHGLTWVKNPPVRWAADVVTILNSSGDEIDWDRLVVVAEARGVSLHVAAPLEFLRSELGARIPIEVIGKLKQAPASRRDRRQHWNWMNNSRGRPVPLMQRHWTMFSRGTAGASLPKRLTMVPQYLRFWAQTDRVWKIPGVLSMKGIRVLGRRMGLYEYWDGS